MTIFPMSGKTYFLTFQRRFGEINVGAGNCFPTLSFLDVGEPRPPAWHLTKDFLVESCGEVFLVFQIFQGASRWIFSFIIFKMDFSQMRWVHVKSIGDCLFFFSEGCSQSSSALKSGLGGDQIFFFLPDDISLYSFHIKERSISVDLTCPNLQPPWKSPFWVMNTSDEVKVAMKKMRQRSVNIKVDMEKIQLININEKAVGVKTADETVIVKISIDECGLSARVGDPSFPQCGCLSHHVSSFMKK